MRSKEAWTSSRLEKSPLLRPACMSVRVRAVRSVMRRDQQNSTRKEQIGRKSTEKDWGGKKKSVEELFWGHSNRHYGRRGDCHVASLLAMTRVHRLRRSQ